MEGPPSGSMLRVTNCNQHVAGAAAASRAARQELAPAAPGAGPRWGLADARLRRLGLMRGGASAEVEPREFAGCQGFS